MTKKLGYRMKIAINLIPIFIGFVAWFFRVGVPYLSEEQRLESIIQNNFSGKAEVIYTMLEEDDPHKETHYILSDGKEYGYLNVYNYRAGRTVRGGPTRNVISLYFEDEMSVVTLTDVDTGSWDVTKAYVAVVCLDENVDHIELEYHNNGFKTLGKLKRATDKVFDGEIYLAEYRLGMEHWDAELYNSDFTAKGYDKDGNFIRTNKCQAQRMEEKINGKD